MKSPFSCFSVFLFSRFLVLAIAVTFLISQASAQIVEIPDLNLRKAIREELQLPAGTPITQQDMEKLQSLDAYSREITDFTGLEYAANLKSLRAWDNPISDLTPLANLTKLEVLDLGGCQIVDLTPLQNLTQLTYLQLSRNPIVAISPLANLTQLEELKLLETPILDYSPIERLAIPRLIRDYPCELPYLPIKERLQNRTFPSVFAAFGKPTDTQVRGLTHLSPIEQLSLHDLTWREPYLGLRYTDTPQGWNLTGFVEKAQEMRDDLLTLNPNMLFLVEVRVRDAWIGYYPEDFPYWLRDEDGNIIKDSYGFLLTDFTQPGLQDIAVQHALAAAKCGIFDGLFFDWFAEAGHTVTLGHYTYEEEQRAKDTILRRIRAAVRDDFLIVINTNRFKIPRRAWGINGIFMEAIPDNLETGYTRDEIKQIEDTLRWAEVNLKAPQINCLEGWGIPYEPPDSFTNLRQMRLFTAMSLTCSDGYVLYGMDNSHQHIWYDFWDADLGRPVGPKAQHYQNIEGLFIREFTNGWAVYNRSGVAQTISLPSPVIPVSDRGNNAASQTHLLPDLDGEIYLKAKNPADVNGDGRINILDLVQIANGFGKSDSDLNGDGVVNILDLTLVVQQFGQ